MTTQEVLAQSIVACKELTARFLPGFTDENRTRQAPGLPNHVTWCLGHCSLMMHRLAERIDGKRAPEAEFVGGDEARRPANAFFVGSVDFASTPVDDTERYPPLARAFEIYGAACDRLAAAVRDAADGTLEREIAWHTSKITLRLLAMRLVFHNGTHTGQILDLRRALGLERVLQ